MSIYTVTFLITMFVILITAVDVKTNRLIFKDNQYEIYTVCIVIFIASLCEYIGKRINGAAPELIWLHRIVKIIEFCASPSIGIAAANAYGSMKKKKLMVGILAVHSVFEIIAAFYGWVFYIDGENLYYREKLYCIYIAVFLLSEFYCYICIIKGNKKFQARLGSVNILILVFLAFGIGVQMIYRDITIDFMCVSICSFFLYHYRGNVINQVDVTTRLLNRRCFKRNTENMKSPACVLFFDVNNFKSINDTFGHSEGDNCLSAVASKIMSVYGRFGYCYRIGRDEFCVMIHKNLDALMR